MLFVCYPKCSTCQKAQKCLEERGVAFTWRDIKQNNPTEAELREWHAQSGLPLKRFFNTSGLVYSRQGTALHAVLRGAGPAMAAAPPLASRLGLPRGAYLPWHALHHAKLEDQGQCHFDALQGRGRRRAGARQGG